MSGGVGWTGYMLLTEIPAHVKHGKSRCEAFISVKYVQKVCDVCIEPGM